MALKDDLTGFVANVFDQDFNVREGRKVPEAEDVGLGNDAVKLVGTVLYADMADSTKMVDKYQAWFSAKVYKSYLYCCARIISSEGGTVTAYDGDRIMGVFIGESKNTSAVRAALKIKWSAEEIVMPKLKAKHPGVAFELQHVRGIDTCELFIAKTGARGANDLVWVGRAANYAAKLSALPPSYTYITKDIYSNIADEAKYSNGVDMWNAVRWNTFDDSLIYRSSYRWRVD